MNSRQKIKRDKRKRFLTTEFGSFKNYKEYKKFYRHTNPLIKINRCNNWLKALSKSGNFTITSDEILEFTNEQT